MRPRFRPATYLPLLLAALLVRALLPTGWMPMARDGALGWTLCPDFLAAPPAPQAMAMAASDHHSMDHAGQPDRKDAPHGKDSCPFGALAGMGGTLAEPPLLADHVEPVAPAPPGLTDLALAQRRWLSHASARGPPAFV